MEARAALADEGIDVAVVNCRFVKPLDEDLIARVASAVGKVLTVEENVLAGGFGSAVLELLEMKGLCGINVKRLGIRDEFVEHATQAEMRRKYGIDAEGIFPWKFIQRIREGGYKRDFSARFDHEEQQGEGRVRG